MHGLSPSLSFNNRKHALNKNSNALEIISLSLWPNRNIKGLAGICSVPYDTAGNWLKKGKRMPHKHKRQLIAHAKLRIKLINEMISLLEIAMKDAIEEVAPCMGGVRAVRAKAGDPMMKRVADAPSVQL